MVRIGAAVYVCIFEDTKFNRSSRSTCKHGSKVLDLNLVPYLLLSFSSTTSISYPGTAATYPAHVAMRSTAPTIVLNLVLVVDLETRKYVIELCFTQVKESHTWFFTAVQCSVQL